MTRYLAPMEQWFRSARLVVRMLWHHLPQHPLSFSLPVLLLSVLIVAQMLLGDPARAFVIAFLAMILCRSLALSLALQRQTPELPRAPRLALCALAALTPLPFALWGDPSLLMRWFHLTVAVNVVFALTGDFARQRSLLTVPVPTAAQLADTRWLARMMLHLSCAWICTLEYLIFMAQGDVAVLAIIAVLLLLAVPMGWRILGDLALMRERAGA